MSESMSENAYFVNYIKLINLICQLKYVLFVIS